MTAGSSDLLRALSAGVQTLAPERTGVSPAGAVSIDRVPFADLLAKARAGNVSSGLPVSIAPGAGLKLTDDQLTRIAAAADRAEAAGASRALVLIDGMSLRLDVGVRSITGTADLDASGVLTGIDAVLRAPPSRVGPGATPILSPPGVGPSTQNASLLRALTGDKDR